MYIITRKIGEVIVIGGVEFSVSRIESKNVLVIANGEVYDFEEKDSFYLTPEVEIKAMSITASKVRCRGGSPESSSY